MNKDKRDFDDERTLFLITWLGIGTTIAYIVNKLLFF